MRRSRYRRRDWTAGNVDVVAIALLELWGLIISLVAAYWVRNRPDLVADIFKTYLTVLLLPAVTGLLGFMRGDSGTGDLPINNAQDIARLTQTTQDLRDRMRQQSDSTPDPDNFYVQQTIEKTISIPPNKPVDDPP